MKPQSTHWIGVDVSKKFFDAALAQISQRFPSTPLRDLPWRRFERTEQGVQDFLRWLSTMTAEEDEAAPRIVMEATGDYSVELTAWLTKHRGELAPAIENPARTKAFIDSLGQRNKTDGLEARGLAFYGVERRPAPYEPLSRERQELRTLNRYRDVLVKERTALKNRMRERCTAALVGKMRARRRKQLDRDIAKLVAHMKRVVSESPRFKNDFRLLTSIAGVGPITAFTILAEVGDLRRFGRARQLTAFAGVSPRITESGSSVRGKTHMCKRGNGRIRQALYLSAMAVLSTKYTNCLRSTHERLCKEGKSGKAALGVLMRKQLVLMRAVLISGKPYNPLWKTEGREHATIAV